MRHERRRPAYWTPWGGPRFRAATDRQGAPRGRRRAWSGKDVSDRIPGVTTTGMPAWPAAFVTRRVARRLASGWGLGSRRGAPRRAHRDHSSRARAPVMFLAHERPADRGVQIVAANIDTVLIVTSCNRDFNPRRLERYRARLGKRRETRSPWSRPTWTTATGTGGTPTSLRSCRGCRWRSRARFGATGSPTCARSSDRRHDGAPGVVRRRQVDPDHARPARPPGAAGS